MLKMHLNNRRTVSSQKRMAFYINDDKAKQSNSSLPSKDFIDRMRSASLTVTVDVIWRQARHILSDARLVDGVNG